MRKKTLAAVISPVLAACIHTASAVPTFNSISPDHPEAISGKRFHVQVFSPLPGQAHLFQRPKSEHAKSPDLIPLTDKYNTLYYSIFQTGSDQQRFTVVQDTGSSNIWIPGISCTSSACRGKDHFNPSSSSSYTSKGEKISIQYGSGNVTGTVGYDYVSAGGLNVSSQGFGVASQLSSDFRGLPFDGLFGLAYKSLSEDNITPWLDNAVSQGLIDKAMFSFYLSNTPGKGDSRLIIGDPDPDYYSGDITWHPLVAIEPDVPANLYYNIAFDSIAAGEQNIPLSCQRGEAACRTIIDSGTSYIIGPKEDVLRIFDALTIKPDCSNLYEQPVLKFTIGGQVYDIPPQYYIVKEPDKSGNFQCVPAIGGEEGSSLWIFGDGFMRALYTVFDKTDARVGFAELPAELFKTSTLRVLQQ